MLRTVNCGFGSVIWMINSTWNLRLTLQKLWISVVRNKVHGEKFLCTGKSLSEALLFAKHRKNKLCTKIVLNVINNFCTHVLPRFELGIFMYWTCNSMSNLSSYCARIILCLFGYLGIMITRRTTVLLYFCCNKRQIWLFLKKLFHSTVLCILITIIPAGQ